MIYAICLEEERGARAQSKRRTRDTLHRLGTGRRATFQSDLLLFQWCVSDYDWSPFCSPRTHLFNCLNPIVPQ